MRNGLARCGLCPERFDFGAFTNRELRLRVSGKAAGKSGFNERLLVFHGKEVRRPRNPELHPDPKHLTWHAGEVFKGKELPCI